MQIDPARLRVAIADPSHFGQSVLADLLADEGVRDITKFAEGREMIAALRDDRFDLVLVDDIFPLLSVVELVALSQSCAEVVPQFLALQSRVTREEVSFLRACGIGGVLLKPVAPKRFSAMFRSLLRVTSPARLAA